MQAVIKKAAKGMILDSDSDDEHDLCCATCRAGRVHSPWPTNAILGNPFYDGKKRKREDPDFGDDESESTDFDDMEENLQHMNPYTEGENETVVDSRTLAAREIITNMFSDVDWMKTPRGHGNKRKHITRLFHDKASLKTLEDAKLGENEVADELKYIVMCGLQWIEDKGFVCN